jgi:hypothetical protein
VGRWAAAVPATAQQVVVAAFPATAILAIVGCVVAALPATVDCVVAAAASLPPRSPRRRIQHCLRLCIQDCLRRCI